MSLHTFRRRAALPTAIGATALTSLALAVPASASGDELVSDSAIAPHAGAHGHFIDEWDSNTTEVDPSENAAVSVLSRFRDVWNPGST